MRSLNYTINKHKVLIFCGLLVSLLLCLIAYERIKNFYLDDAISYSYIKPTAPHSEEQLIVSFKKPYNPFYLQKEIDRRSNNLGILVGIEDGWNMLVDKPHPEQTLQIVNSRLQEIGVSSYRKLDRYDIEELNASFVLFFNGQTDIESKQVALQELGFFEISEPDFKMELFATPNDPIFNDLWGMKTIQAPLAWDVNTGSRDVVVAVIDSGSESTHPDLAANMIDGRNILTGGAVNDQNGHGTHVAGTVGAVGNNGIGVVGVSWNVSIMPVQVFGASGGLQDSSPIYEAISYATANGADVINMSLGGRTPCSPGSQYETRINYAISQGIVVVVAAGNGHPITKVAEDASLYSPAGCAGAITVGATGQSDARASFSNFGSVVDIAAPGVGINSTIPGGGYKANNGTSMASPHVAGAAALLLSVNPSLSPSEVRDCLVNNGDPITTDRPIGGVRLNVFKALQECGDPSSLPTATPTLLPGEPTLTLTPTITPTNVPGVPTNTPTPTRTPTPTVLLPTPTPTIGGFRSRTTPIPTPDAYFTCDVDPACIKSGKSLRLCPLICTPI